MDPLIYKVILVLLFALRVNGDSVVSVHKNGNTTEKSNSCKDKNTHIMFTPKESNQSEPLSEIKAYFINDTCAESLNVGELEIKTISPEAFNGLPNLKRLELKYNGPEDFFSFGAHENLESIKVYGHLKSIDFSSISDKLPNLKELRVRNTSLESLVTDPSCDLPKLTELDLSANILNTTKNIPKTVKRLLLNDAAELNSSEFEETLCNLESLSLNNNRHFETLGDPDSKNCNGKYLCLNLPNLQELSLKECSMKATISSAFSKLKNLRALHLQGTNLAPIPHSVFRSLPNLVRLDISDTFYSCRPNLNVLPKLEVLVMDNMKNKSHVEEMLETGLKLAELKTLSIKGNELTYVPKNTLNKLKKLEELHLSNNHIKELIFPIEMLNLRRLCMGHNLVTDIDNISLNKTNSLEHLGIGHNVITSLKKKSLMNLPDTLEIHFGSSEVC